MMKRTPTNGGEKRGLVFRFRVTAAEKIKLQERAAAEKMKVSPYIRKQITQENSGIDRRDYIRLLAEMGKQGSNLNQIAKAYNVRLKTGEPLAVDPGLIRSCLNEVMKLCTQLMDIIKHGHRRKNTQ